MSQFENLRRISFGVSFYHSGSFTYYVITKGNDYANVIFALSNAEFDYGRGEGV